MPRGYVREPVSRYPVGYRLAPMSRIFLDVRTPEEYAGGHVPGARNLDIRSDSFVDDVLALDRTASYGVYCHSGGRSQVAVQFMMAQGFTDVTDLQTPEAAAASGGHGLVTG